MLCEGKQARVTPEREMWLKMAQQLLKPFGVLPEPLLDCITLGEIDGTTRFRKEGERGRAGRFLASARALNRNYVDALVFASAATRLLERARAATGTAAIAAHTSALYERCRRFAGSCVRRSAGWPVA